MKTFKLLLPFLLLLLLLVSCCSVQGALTFSGRNIADGATGVWVDTPFYNMTVTNTSAMIIWYNLSEDVDGDGTYETAIQTYHLTAQSSGSKTLTFNDTLDSMTDYQISCRVYLTGTGYCNFTTGQAGLSDNNAFDDSQKVILGIIAIIVIIGLVIGMYYDIRSIKKLTKDDLKRFFYYILAMCIMSIMILFL